MAATLQLSYSSTTLNLHASEDAGWRVSDWRPACAKDGEEWVWEEMIADVDEESDDSLATSVRAMEAMQGYAQAYRTDILRTTPVWLTCQMTGETNARRACVREIQIIPQSDEFGPGLADDHRIRFRLRIERRAFWEATSATTNVSTSSVSGLGGEVDYTSSADVAGTVPARLYKLAMSGSGASNDIYHIWAGFFDKAKGSWTSKTELESQTLSTDATATADATASPGTGNSRVTVSFATLATWGARVGNFAIPNTGRILVLCRAYVDSGTVAEIRLQRNEVYGQIVRVSGTTWTMHEMDVIRNPNYGRLAYEPLSSAGNSIFTSLYARRVSGSGNLYLDFLGYVPADELIIHAEAQEAAPFDSTLPAYCNETPDGLRSAVTYTATTTLSIYYVAVSSWYGAGVPVGDGRLYVFAARADKVSTYADTLTVDVQVVPRWRMLRGSN